MGGVQAGTRFWGSLALTLSVVTRHPRCTPLDAMEGESASKEPLTRESAAREPLVGESISGRPSSNCDRSIFPS